MQDQVMHAQTHPFFQLAQANMDLLMRFSSAPEVKTQAAANVDLFVQQATESAFRLMRSGAYAELVQGMLKNYSAFLVDMSRTGMTLMGQGQAALMQQMGDAQEAVAEAADVTDVRVRRARQAA